MESLHRLSIPDHRDVQIVPFIFQVLEHFIIQLHQALLIHTDSLRHSELLHLAVNEAPVEYGTLKGCQKHHQKEKKHRRYGRCI